MTAPATHTHTHTHTHTRANAHTLTQQGKCFCMALLSREMSACFCHLSTVVLAAV
jgi:hypothetical protein